ncbi:hypothetical protein C7B65_09155 [Phormidesmis priestleyi ULC007]|uniref:Glutathione S-transferase n=1 Tax=Phormidesmis priestleyi ULC007 TaxID=1920490 RepID=A0A2T1DI98_9CYAN|nr:hypothetical protein [Phormidesmis priestleyi]PSB20202.1 hypothetical protein C7B65_09155 [Phormidesmis priestleyi ULC007]
MTKSVQVLSLLLLSSPFYPLVALSLPPADDPPEEVLRSEIITDARSPIDGKPLTAAEYAELQSEIQQGQPVQPQLSPKVRKTIGLLRLRRFIKTFFPFIPLK